MPDELEVPLEHSQEHIDELHQERFGDPEGKEAGKGKSDWTRFVAVATAVFAVIAALTKCRRVWFFGLAAGLVGTALLVGGLLGLRLPFAF